MVDVKNRVHSLKERSDKPARIRVWPAREDVRMYIKHPAGRIAFRATLAESVEWPVDAFTLRRIKDGDVLLDAPSGDASVPDNVELKARGGRAK